MNKRICSQGRPGDHMLSATYASRFPDFLGKRKMENSTTIFVQRLSSGFSSPMVLFMWALEECTYRWCFLYKKTWFLFMSFLVCAMYDRFLFLRVPSLLHYYYWYTVLKGYYDCKAVNLWPKIYMIWLTMKYISALLRYSLCSKYILNHMYVGTHYVFLRDTYFKNVRGSTID